MDTQEGIYFYAAEIGIIMRPGLAFTIFYPSGGLPFPSRGGAEVPTRTHAPRRRRYCDALCRIKTVLPGEPRFLHQLGVFE